LPFKILTDTSPTKPFVRVSAICFSLDEQYLISGSFDQTIKIWNIAAEECRQTLQGHQNAVSSIICDPSGSILFGSSLDETIRVWV
jgi:WD40 repeat protein